MKSNIEKESQIWGVNDSLGRIHWWSVVKLDEFSILMKSQDHCTVFSLNISAGSPPFTCGLTLMFPR